MHFQYYFPNVRKLSMEQLQQAGLGYVFERETPAFTRTPFTPISVSNGPDGQHGVIVSLSDEHIGYYPKQQTWKKEVDTDYWVGMWNDAARRPTPESLARENQIAGRWLTLSDGHDWLLPMTRLWVAVDGELVYRRTLPTRLTRDEFGNWVPGEVKNQYRELSRLAGEFMDAVISGTVSDFTEFDNLVIEAFRTNYRVSAMEIALLELHEDHLRQKVAAILTDMENFNQLLQTLATTDNSGSATPEQRDELTAV